MKETSTINNKLVLTIDELASLLGFTESRLRYELRMQRIPHLKLGRSIRFRWSDIEAWLEKNLITNL